MIVEFFLLAAILLHLLICPFTKVEESFNMQAFHDIIYRGVKDISKYDHHGFPGVVPRTFIGPLFVSALSYPVLLAARAAKLPTTLGISEKFLCQYIVRGVLALCVFYCIMKFRSAVTKVFGYGAARWFVLITSTQFHLVFYASRSLPNTFALALTLLALSYFMKQDHHKFIMTASFAMIVFRGELALLFGSFLLMELIGKRISITNVLKYGVTAVVLSLALSVGVDSYFWRRWVWPEGEVLWYNTILNKSSNWGTSPFLWYFYSALPRALLASLFFVPIGAYLDSRARNMALPAVIFIFLFSNLPHKETRFIFYALPLLNLAAAVGCDRIWKNSRKSVWWIILMVAVLWQIVINLMGTSAFLYLSHDNYPGARAIRFMNRMHPPDADIHVHIDAFSAQNGITQFLQHDKWTYDKSETLLPTSKRMIRDIQYAISKVGEDQERFERKWGKTHVIVGEIYAYHNITIDLNKVPPFEIHNKMKVMIFENMKFLGFSVS